MERRFLLLCSLVLAFSAPVAHAQAQAAPAATNKSTANPIDPASIQALKDMGAYLQTLKRFHVQNELTAERVLADGQKLQHSATADIEVARPNKLRVVIVTPQSERELFYDGKMVTLFRPVEKYYSSAEFTDTLGGLATRLQEKFGVELPLADLFLWGTPAAPLDKIESAMNAGQAFVGNDLCDHYAFREGTIDWQIWITAGSKPLPRKIIIANRSDEARPQSVSVIKWNPNQSFPDSVFTFTPPAGSTKIEMVPVKAK